MREHPEQTILRHMPAGVATLQGPELRYGFVNEAMETVLGGPAPAGTPIVEHPGFLAADLLDVMQRVYASGRPFVAKAYCLALPGPSSPDRYYDLTLEPFRETDNAITGLLLFAVDVTAQEEARQQAHKLAVETRRLDTRLRVLTETVPQITFTLDAKGHYEYVSPQWYYFTGQPPTAAVDAIWPLLIHPDDRLRVLYQSEAARAAGTGWSYEYRLRRHDGQYRWLLSRALPEQLHAPGEPVFWHGALTEIHDQRELTEALRRGEAELRFLADSIPELIWTATAEGFIDYYNRHTGEYTGLTQDELGPTGWVNLLASKEQAEAARQWVRSMATGEPFEGVFRMRRHDGQYRWHIIRARQLADGQGLRWFGACTDVDDQHRLREVLQTQYNELARTNHDLDTFVYTASHDLKQPLVNLRGLFEELSRVASFDDPQASHMLHMVEDALAQLELTIQDLAATVQDQRGLSAPAERLDLRSIADEILLGLRTQFEQAGATLEFDLDEAPTLHFGRANLRSILHNLLSNALKFSHPERPARIQVRSYLLDGQPVLSVQDNGLGMEVPQPHSPGFRPFTRQHMHVPGAGVGMYLVQRILTSRGGHLEVVSTLGEGTTFMVHWATAQPDASLAP
jgi:PAS domain S-box-containing protein